MKKLILTALAVFFVSGPAFALDSATHFKDYIANGTTPATKKGMLKARTTSGDILSFGRKANLASLAVTVGATVGAIYFEDELNASLYELFLGEPLPSAGSGGFTDIDGTWQDGFFYTQYAALSNKNRHSPTRLGACLAMGGTQMQGSSCFDANWLKKGETRGPYSCGQYLSLDVDSLSMCGQSPTPANPLDDGIPQFSQVNGYALQPTEDPDQIQFPDNRWFEVDPDAGQARQRVKVEVLPNGNTRVTTQTEYLDENGNLRTKTDVTEMDTGGNVVSQSTSDTEGGLDSAAAEEAAKGPQDVNVLNDNLAQEETLKEISESLKFDQAGITPLDPTIMNVPLTDLKTEIEGTSAVLGDVPFYSYLTGFGGSGSCQGISYNLGPYGSGAFNSHCPFIDNIAKPVIGFLFAVTTILYLAFLYRRETSRGF